MEKILSIFTVFLGATALIVIFSTLMAFPIMWLWNYVMPDLFGLKEIYLGQALALNFLCACLFKSSAPFNSKDYSHND